MTSGKGLGVFRGLRGQPRGTPENPGKQTSNRGVRPLKGAPPG